MTTNFYICFLKPNSMKKIVLLICICGGALICIAQNGWQKNDNENLWGEGLSLLSKYQQIPKEKKEIIAGCYLDKITATYSLEAYKNLIDYRSRTLQKETITKCAKDIGFDLDEPKEAEKKPEPKSESTEYPKKENLIGHWEDEDNEFWLNESGDFKRYNVEGKTLIGTWKVDGNIFSTIIRGRETNYKVLSFNKTSFVYQTIDKRKITFKATRMK